MTCRDVDSSAFIPIEEGRMGTAILFLPVGGCKTVESGECTRCIPLCVLWLMSSRRYFVGKTQPGEANLRILTKLSAVCLNRIDHPPQSIVKTSDTVVGKIPACRHVSQFIMFCFQLVSGPCTCAAQVVHWCS